MDWADRLAEDLVSGIVEGKLDHGIIAARLRMLHMKAQKDAMKEASAVIADAFNKHSIGGGDK